MIINPSIVILSFSASVCITWITQLLLILINPNPLRFGPNQLINQTKAQHYDKKPKENIQPQARQEMSTSIPRTYKAFRRTNGKAPLHVQLVEEILPSSLSTREVLIRIRAVSLNYRDVAMLNGKYPSHALEQGIPASDCAAEVIAMGENVSGFEIGDRVAPIFDLNALEGTETIKRTLGGDVDGVLREFAIFDQAVLVHLPEHLSWEEVCASTNLQRLCLT